MACSATGRLISPATEAGEAAANGRRHGYWLAGDENSNGSWGALALATGLALHGAVLASDAGFQEPVPLLTDTDTDGQWGCGMNTRTGMRLACATHVSAPAWRLAQSDGQGLTARYVRTAAQHESESEQASRNGQGLFPTAPVDVAR